MNVPVSEILHKQLREEPLTAEEKGLLDEWIAASDSNEEVHRLLNDPAALKKELALRFELEGSGDAAMAAFKELMNKAPIRQGNFFTAGWMRYAAAILVLAAAGLWIFNGKKETMPVVATHKPDVAPGGNKAVLTLADGSTIILDSAKNGSLALQGSSNIIKSADGQLAYNTNSQAGDKIIKEELFNTISTPKGGNYQLVLPDGSKVWLNAASSLRFPAVFAGKERKVSLKGEAYFEIASDKSRPFQVEAGGVKVGVLGTSFNLMAYNDEPAIKTTLLQGSIKVAAAGGEIVLKPGEQASVGTTEIYDEKIGSRTLDALALEQVTAWKNNEFRFNNDNLEDIMRQISRWYDVEVIYENDVRKMQFAGGISKKETLSAVLEQLKLTGTVSFSIEGNTVHVRK